MDFGKSFIVFGELILLVVEFGGFEVVIRKCVNFSVVILIIIRVWGAVFERSSCRG